MSSSCLDIALTNNLFETRSTVTLNISFVKFFFWFKEKT